MDSGNTAGSLQSSEDECNSRAAALQDSGGFITTHYQPPPPPFNHQNLINNPFFFTPSPQHHLINLDSKTVPSFSDHHFFTSPSPTQPAAHTIPFSPVKSTEPIIPTDPPPVARNPKKRSRASRRAPTTVLATDTNNFRAMVQEFTGIPAPPFTSTSPTIPNLTTSFDLFGKPSVSSMMRSTTNNFDNLPQLPPYLLHPFQQKLQSSPSYSSSISSLLDSGNLLNTMQNTFTFPSNFSYQSPLIHNQKTTQNVVSLNGIGVIGKTQSYEEHATLRGLISTAPAPTTTTRRNDNQVASGNWGGDGKVKESSGMKDDQGLIEPRNFSSD